jgi:hypothetical protein
MSARSTPPTAAFPNTIGSPGASVHNLGGKFGREQASAGTDGEVRTARALTDICRPGGPTVLHDLVLPMNGITANIDHIVISGKEVRILDSKMWTPGFYWTFAGHTRRGLTRIDHADKQTMAMATIAINKILSNTGVHFVMKRPVFVVWPSNTKKQMVLRLFRPYGAKATTGRNFAARTRHYAGAQPANQELVAALVPLVISLRHQHQRTPNPVQQAPLANHAAAFSLEPEFVPEPEFVQRTIAENAPAKKVYESDDF